MGHLGISPSEFWDMTVNEIWCIYYAKLPDKSETKGLSFSEEEMEHMKAVDKEWTARRYGI